MSARPTFESESSFWPTATASSGGYNQGGAAGLTGPIRPSLETIARNWPTPTASDGMKGTTDGRTRQGGPSLTMAVRWPTPMARDGDNRRDMSGQASAQRRLDKGKRNLEDAISASMWPTPHAHDAATPKTPAQISAMRERSGAGVRNLNEMVLWPTPTAQDSAASGGRNEASRKLGSKTHPGTTLSDLTVSRRARPGSPTGMVLSPRFVEAMMGYQDGHTACDFSAIQSSRNKRRTPG